MKTYDETIASVHGKMEAEKGRMKIRRGKIKASLTALSCICLAVLSGAMLWGSGAQNRTEPEGVDTAAVSENTGAAEGTDTKILPEENVIYGELSKNEPSGESDGFALVDTMEEENLFTVPESGKITLMNGLTEALDKEHGENQLFAVALNIGRQLDYSQCEEWVRLREEIDRLSVTGKDRYYNHRETDKENHPRGGFEEPRYECEVCLEIRRQIERDSEITRELSEKASKVERAYRQSHREEDIEIAREYAASLGYGAKEVTVIFGNETDSDDTKHENTECIFVLHLTEAKIRSLPTHGNSRVGIRCELIPEWLDGGESVVYAEPILSE